MRRAYRRVGLASVAVLLVLAACVGPRSFMGPVTGRVELADATALPDEEVVVYLRCSSYALHGTWPSDRESRVVAPGERFLFLWAYRGLAPAACTVQVIHPLHRSGYARLRGGLRETLPPFQLESFDAYLTRGPGPDERQERWATQAFTSHLSAVDHHFVPALSQTLRRERFVHYMPELHRLFERVRERDGFGPWTPWTRDTLRRLRRIEEQVQYPAPQVALFAAAEAGDVERLRSLAAAGAMLDAWNDERETALYLAARNGHRSAVAALLDAGAEIDRPGHGDGCGTPLLGALFERQWGTAALLVRRGADLELDCRGQRVLGWRLTGLARDGATAPLRSLLEAGVPPDTPARGGYTALMGAVETRRPETVAALLRAGADASARADDGRTPLGIARAAGSQELVELLEAER